MLKSSHKFNIYNLMYFTFCNKNL